MIILRSSANPLMAFHFSLVRLYKVELRGRSENISFSIWLENISSVSPVILYLKDAISVKSAVGLLWTKHLHLIFLSKSAKSLLMSASFINVGVGEKPSSFPKTLVSKSVNYLWLWLNTASEPATGGVL